MVLGCLKIALISLVNSSVGKPRISNQYLGDPKLSYVYQISVVEKKHST